MKKSPLKIAIFVVITIFLLTTILTAIVSIREVMAPSNLQPTLVPQTGDLQASGDIAPAEQGSGTILSGDETTPQQ